MTKEDEAFNEIEQRAKQRMESVRVAMRSVEDDDIQEYKKPWVGLTDEEVEVIEALKAPPVHPDFVGCDDWMEFARAVENKLKQKNT